MTFEFLLPDIGEGVVEGEIVKWLVAEGDRVAEDQPMVEIMTDKATVVIPSPKAGKVVKLHGAEGVMAKTHHPLVTLELEGAPARPVGAGGKAVAVVEASDARPAPAAQLREQAAKQSLASAFQGQSPGAGGTIRVLATPVTRRIAREHGVDLRAVAGTGPMGRVMKVDVLRMVGPEKGTVPISGMAVHAAMPGKGIIPADERIPLRGLRKRIAEKMARSRRTAAHFTFVEEVDMSALVAMRARMNEALKSEGVKLTFLPFIVKAAVAALKKYPWLNAVMDEEKQELVVRRAYNIGIAAATESGLTVPVVKDADQKSIRALAQEIERLANAARENTLKLDELTGGTFTITSLGALGGIFATPIINHPEVAICGIHRIEKRPVVVEQAEAREQLAPSSAEGTSGHPAPAHKIVVQDRMYLSLSFDHRVIDGHVGAAFAYEMIKYLQAPDLLFLDLT